MSFNICRVCREPAIKVDILNQGQHICDTCRRFLKEEIFYPELRKALNIKTKKDILIAKQKMAKEGQSEKAE